MSTRILVPVLALLGLAACEMPEPSAPAAEPAPAAPAAEAHDPPAARLPEPPAVEQRPLDATPPGASTAEALDTTTESDRAAALTPAPGAGSARLGTTVASLGPPAEPGIWVETPLVAAVTQGRVEDPATGQSIAVELRPSGGAPGSGSQISIAAMRLLGLSLTSLPELVVYRS